MSAMPKPKRPSPAESNAAKQRMVDRLRAESRPSKRRRPARAPKPTASGDAS